MKLCSCLSALVAVSIPFLASSHGFAQTATAPVPATTAVVPKTISYPERTTLWEKSIVRFEERDRAVTPPAPGGIVFVGSSTIVNWSSLAKDFPSLPVVNRGFGGSEIQDSTYYAARILFPYKPRTVVFYAGDNDIAAGHTTEQVVGDFQMFAKKVRAELPDTQVVFLAIKPSPSRWKMEGQMLAANKAIREWIGTQKNMTYIDVHTPMLGADGMPRIELYRDDKLHMTPEGYKLWTSIVAPYLK